MMHSLVFSNNELIKVNTEITNRVAVKLSTLNEKIYKHIIKLGSQLMMIALAKFKRPKKFIIVKKPEMMK